MRSDRRHGRTGDQRTVFQRDRDRVLYSEAFRRLQGVTQVVSAREGLVFHNRMTHSLKVAQVARRIAEYLLDPEQNEPARLEAVGGLDADVAEAAGLAHDLGHPPFGHVGEYKLQELTGEAHFEGNAQSFRILVALEPHGIDYRGLDLTRATLCGVLKYPWPRHEAGGHEKKKYGTYASDLEAFSWARRGLPADDKTRSLEAEIMDLADDITFAIHDTEDFYRAGMIPLESLCDVSRGGKAGDLAEFQRLIQDIERRWRRKVTEEEQENLARTLLLLGVSGPYRGTRTERIAVRKGASGLIGEFVREGLKIKADWKPGERRVVVQQDVELSLKMLKELVWTYVIDRPSLASQQAGHEAVIEGLYAYFHRDLEKGLVRRIPPQFIEIVQERNKSVDSNARLAADMVCSLTDEQALGLYRRISGSDPGAITAPLF